jgi:F0F1-type ATP synthase membrane subunit b/b'
VHLKATAESERDEYEKALHNMRAGLAAAAAAARNAAAEQQARILADARDAASEELGKLRESLAKQVGTARRTLAADADGIATEMLARATGGSAA